LNKIDDSTVGPVSATATETETDQENHSTELAVIEEDLSQTNDHVTQDVGECTFPGGRDRVSLFSSMIVSFALFHQ